MSGLFGALAERKSNVLASLPEFLRRPESKSGVVVNATTALEVTTVLACARVLAEGVSQVPFKIMKRRAGKGSDEAPEHPLYWLLHRKPNFYQTSFEFRETLMLHLVLCGNAFVFKSKTGRGKIVELIPLQPGRVQVEQLADMSLKYTVSGTDGRQKVVPSDQIWHIRGPSWNSWAGLEPVRLAREAIGLAISLEASHSELHKNGSQFSGVYSFDGPLSQDQFVKLSDWIKAHAKGDPLILDRGAKWLQQTMTGVDSQHIETRNHQIEEICSALRVMPIMIGHSDKAATYASAEQMFIAHVVHSLTPWAERLEQSVDVNLIDDEQHYALLDLRGMMRGALKDQAEYYAKALGSGGAPAWMSQDEVRDDLDLNPMGGEAASLPIATNVAQGGADGTP